MLDDLTSLEEAVTDAVRRGVVVEPRATVEVADRADLRVRAVLLRELLLGRRGELDPRGLRIRGVRVVGQLDLDHVTAVTGPTLSVVR